MKLSAFTSPNRILSAEKAPQKSLVKKDQLYAEGIQINYHQNPVFDSLDVTIPDNKFSVIVGPNGCGKSTLLRTLCRLLKPDAGQVVLDHNDIKALPTKTLAKRIGLLPQQVQSPEGIRVKDLVSRGRYPHQTMFHQWSIEDEEAVLEAMKLTQVDTLALRLVDELSGGQRQRVWIAMVLAQNTPILFLDEPTTYLDIAHQIELLELCRNLNQKKQRTIVAVLHDLNQAFRYADHIIVMHKGKIAAEGAPNHIISESLIQRVFDLKCMLAKDPVAGTPWVIPAARQ